MARFIFSIIDKRDGFCADLFRKKFHGRL
jgi:hypothetical protein